MSKCHKCNTEIKGDKFYHFGAGALKIEDEDNAISFPRDEALSFATVSVHDHGLYDIDFQGLFYAEVGEHGANGQFEFYFCSKQCLLNYFTDHVNSLANLT